MIKAENTTKAVCPFCRRYISTAVSIYSTVIADSDKKGLKHVLSGRANSVKCSLCGGEFFYEHNFLIVNAEKNYAVAVIAEQRSSLPAIRLPFFKILGKDNFKLRYVDELIQAIEKVRIFEAGLDDSIMEAVKYKYILNKGDVEHRHKIILTGASKEALEFTVYNEYDTPVAAHRVATEVYYSESKNFNGTSLTGWQKIDIQHTKESIK